MIELKNINRVFIVIGMLITQFVHGQKNSDKFEFQFENIWITTSSSLLESYRPIGSMSSKNFFICQIIIEFIFTFTKHI